MRIDQNPAHLNFPHDLLPDSIRFRKDPRICGRHKSAFRDRVLGLIFRQKKPPDDSSGHVGR